MSIIIHYFAGEKVVENETDKENGTYGGGEEFIESAVGETRRKETTWKT